MISGRISGNSDGCFICSSYDRTVYGNIPSCLQLTEDEINTISKIVAEVANNNENETKNVVPIRINLKRKDKNLQLRIIADIQDDMTTVIFY